MADRLGEVKILYTELVLFVLIVTRLIKGREKTTRYGLRYGYLSSFFFHLKFKTKVSNLGGSLLSNVKGSALIYTFTYAIKQWIVLEL